MASDTGFYFNELLQLNALNAREQFDDDDDDEEAFDDDDDDDEEAFGDDDDDDDDEETFGEYADAAFPERRRRRRRRSYRRPRYRRYGRRRRLGRIRGSRSTTLRSRTGRRMRVRFGKSYATTAEVNKLIKDTERKFAAAVKERKTNFDRLSKQISKATRNLDGKVATVRKSVKKLESQGQTSALLGLLQGPPKVKSIRITEDVVKNKDLAATVEFEKQNILLPLLLTGGLGGLGGSGGDQTLLLALAFGSL